jgi:hypothetical protein
MCIAESTTRHQSTSQIYKKATMRLARTALLLIASGMALQAQAQSYLSPTPEKYSVEDRFRLEVDVLYGSYDTQMRLDDTTNAVDVNGKLTGIVKGTTISGEDDLGLAKSQVLGQVELTLLPGRHHLVRLNALSMRRSAQTVLTRNINWGNNANNTNGNDAFVKGDRVDSFLNYSMVGLSYGYLPLRTDRYELGITFGIQFTTVGMNVEVPAKAIREAENGVAPLPMFGIEGRYEFTRRWSVDARYTYVSAAWAESFGADLKDKEGTVSDGRIAVRWRQNQHLVFGLGYRFFNLDISAPSSDPAGAVTMGMSGPLLFVQGSL